MSTSDGANLPIFAEKLKLDGDDRVESTATSEPTDEALLVRLQSADMEAASQLFTRYARMMLGIARRVLQDAEEAEDLVQDVFLFLIFKSKLFDPAKGSAHAWIMQVTYHRAYDRRRYLNARSFYDRSEHFDQLPPSSGENVEEFLAWQSALRPAFEQLSEEQRQSLTLYFYEGYTIREISERMNQSVGNVQHYLYRGLDKMRKNVFGLDVGEKK